SGKARDEACLDFRHWRLGPRRPGQRGDPSIGDTAGDDQAEEVEVGRDVEGKSVAGDPSRDTHADRADLGVPDPRTTQPGDPSRGEAIVGTDADHHLFQIAYVAMHVAT